jgi:DNA-binding protein HU-beta
MTKADLIQKVAAECCVSKMDADIAVTSILGGITRALASGEDVKISGLGTFKVKTREARQGRNPRTGEAVDIPEKKAVRFIPGAALKVAVQDGRR